MAMNKALVKRASGQNPRGTRRAVVTDAQSRSLTRPSDGSAIVIGFCCYTIYRLQSFPRVTFPAGRIAAALFECHRECNFAAGHGKMFVLTRLASRARAVLHCSRIVRARFVAGLR